MTSSEILNECGPHAAHVWYAVFSFVEREMMAGRGVSVKGLGTFSFVTQVTEKGNRGQAITKIPSFTLSEVFINSYGATFVKPPFSEGIVITQLNATSVAPFCGVDRENVLPTFKAIISVIGDRVKCGRGVDIDIKVGQFICSNRRISVRFYDWFATSLARPISHSDKTASNSFGTSTKSLSIKTSSTTASSPTPFSTVPATSATKTISTSTSAKTTTNGELYSASRTQTVSQTRRPSSQTQRPLSQTQRPVSQTQRLQTQRPMSQTLHSTSSTAHFKSSSTQRRLSSTQLNPPFKSNIAPTARVPSSHRRPQWQTRPGSQTQSLARPQSQTQSSARPQSETRSQSHTQINENSYNSLRTSNTTTTSKTEITTTANRPASNQYPRDQICSSCLAQLDHLHDQKARMEREEMERRQVQEQALLQQQRIMAEIEKEKEAQRKQREMEQQIANENRELALAHKLQSISMQNTTTERVTRTNNDAEIQQKREESKRLAELYKAEMDRKEKEKLEQSRQEAEEALLGRLTVEREVKQEEEQLRSQKREEQRQVALDLQEQIRLKTLSSTETTTTVQNTSLLIGSEHECTDLLCIRCRRPMNRRMRR
ncbi:hypothetical protein Pelo_12234 [Pelomyxa schiedti]|nr:hypothetical protein Pelo_12234 [Pelomyxa schiedti]